jgi:hypothetical protein
MIAFVFLNSCEPRKHMVPESIFAVRWPMLDSIPFHDVKAILHSTTCCAAIFVLQSFCSVAIMFGFTHVDAVLVGASHMDQPVQLSVSKIEDRQYFDAVKRNKALQRILMSGVDHDYQKMWRTKLSCTNVFETLKKMRDKKFDDHMRQAPSRRSRRFKTFVLQLPDSCAISTPSVGEVGGVEMRVRLSSLFCTKCTHNLFKAI